MTPEREGGGRLARQQKNPRHAEHIGERWCTRQDSNLWPSESEQAVPPFLWGVLVSYKCLKTLINQWFPAVLPVFLYLPVIPRIC